VKKPDKAKIKIHLVAFYTRVGVDPYKVQHRIGVIQHLDQAFNSLLNAGHVLPGWRRDFKNGAMFEFNKERIHAL